eukprot:NODE_14327_length_344_cov_3.338983_g13164_i0.p2 GENE.NODE_14327_length_344_cov_3.338983_g13164_i0~~NODE_14327_length_344_cov_3.338983_g13164_i0.p2  ORF type:complete len:67 (+),score=3.25 NODE_14327_length_344_cov_3.338983_g13164_i0:83-283(+)
MIRACRGSREHLPTYLSQGATLGFDLEVRSVVDFPSAVPQCFFTRLVGNDNLAEAILYSAGLEAVC